MCGCDFNTPRLLSRNLKTCEKTFMAYSSTEGRSNLYRGLSDGCGFDCFRPLKVRCNLQNGLVDDKLCFSGLYLQRGDF